MVTLKWDKWEATKEERIARINELVQIYKTTTDKEEKENALHELLCRFSGFIVKTLQPYQAKYQCTFTWEEAYSIGIEIFINLLDEFTIGGSAFWNVYLERKFWRRINYQYKKKTKENYQNMATEDGSLNAKYIEKNQTMQEDFAEDLAQMAEDSARVRMVMQLLDDEEFINERDRGIVLESFNGKNHTQIGKEYGISRSRVSRIVRKYVDLIREEIEYYESNFGK